MAVGTPASNEYRLAWTMSQPLPSRQRKAWLPPSLSAVRYPATPRPSRASTTTIQSGPPWMGATGSIVFGRFSLAISAPRAPHGARLVPQDYRTEVRQLPGVFERIYSLHQGGGS